MIADKLLLVLSLLAVISLFSCIPVPYTVDYDDAPDLDEIEKQVKNLQLSGSHRSLVVETLGRPLRYRQNRISYEACKDPHAVDMVIVGIYSAHDVATYKSDLKCYEVWLDFGSDERLKSYSVLPRDWNLDEIEEDLHLRKLGQQGDTTARRFWKQSRTYYTSQDKIVVEERIENEREYEIKRKAVSSDLKTRAEAGNAAAQYKLFLLENRVPVVWLCRAADQGYMDARIELAYLYRSGAYGFTQDYTRAYVWYRLAGSGSQREAVERCIKGLEKKSFWGPVSTASKACQIASEIVQLRSLLGPVGVSNADQILAGWQPGQCERELTTTSSGN